MTENEVDPTRLEVGSVPAPEVRPQGQPENGSALPRLAGYSRVSTAEQATNGAGLPAQRAAIASGDGHRYTVVAWFEDAGLSAKSLDRPGLTEALTACSTGTVDGIVVAKLDRLSRSVIHFGQLLEQSRREGWHIVALDLGVDTTTASGELVANVLMAVAQWERKTIGERTKAALAEKRAQGVRLGRPPELDPAVKARIRSMRGSGLGVSEIARALNEEGVPAARGGLWSHKAVAWVLR